MSVEQITDVAQECYDQALRTRRPTREVARDLVSQQDPDLILSMAVEFIVEAVSRTQRARTLAAERAAERSLSAQSAEIVGPPRKGTRARYVWETETEEGRAWAAEEQASHDRYMSKMIGSMQRLLDDYARDLRIQWNAELLDSTFALSDGTLVTWGDATADQHAERRQLFLNNAHANMEGAARHEVALRELEESGKPTLREMVGAAA